VNQDVPPYTKAVGNPVHLYGLNSVGLQRAGSLRREAGPEARLPAAVQFRHDGESGNRQGARRATTDSRSSRTSSSSSKGSQRGVLCGPHHRCGWASSAPVRSASITRGCCGAWRRVPCRDLRQESRARRRGGEAARDRGAPALAALLERVDAVTVAVPTPAHVDVGTAVLERGIALLMRSRSPTRRGGGGAGARRRGAGHRCSRWDTWSGSTGRYGRPPPTSTSLGSCRSTALPVPAARHRRGRDSRP